MLIQSPPSPLPPVPPPSVPIAARPFRCLHRRLRARVHARNHSAVGTVLQVRPPLRRNVVRRRAGRGRCRRDTSTSRSCHVRLASGRRTSLVRRARHSTDSRPHWSHCAVVVSTCRTTPGATSTGRWSRPRAVRGGCPRCGGRRARGLVLALRRNSSRPRRPVKMYRPCKSRGPRASSHCTRMNSPRSACPCSSR